MNKEIFQQVFPRQFVLKHLLHNERVDGRAFDDFRRVVLEKTLDKTLIHGSFTAKTLKKGVFGSNKQSERPITISIEGEENLKSSIGKDGSSHELKFAIIKIIKNAVLRTRPQDFNSLLKTDENDNSDDKNDTEDDSFKTVEIKLRIILDEGNSTQALLTTALSMIYIHNELSIKNDEEIKQQRRIEDSSRKNKKKGNKGSKTLIENELCSSNPAPETSYFIPLAFQILDNKYLICDPSWQEENAEENSSILILHNMMNPDSYSILKPGGSAQDSKELLLNIKNLVRGKNTEFKKYVDFLKNCDAKTVSIF